MIKKIIVRPQTRPWPLPHGGWPADQNELKLLDDRFIDWLSEFVDRSMTRTNQELSSLNVQPKVRRHIEGVFRAVILSEWARSLVNLDDIVHLACYGTSRDHSTVAKAFREIFGQDLTERI